MYKVGPLLYSLKVHVANIIFFNGKMFICIHLFFNLLFLFFACPTTFLFRPTKIVTYSSRTHVLSKEKSYLQPCES